MLIVEDERLLGEAMCEFLEGEYAVELATTAGAAIRKLRADGSIDVVLCDVQLPDGTVVQIHQAYRAAWPDRVDRFVFLTGGTDDPAVRALIQMPNHAVLRKPFNLDVLPGVIERQLSVAGLR